MEINKNLKFLRKKSNLVTEVDEEVRSLVSEMIKTMDANSGVGLAAPQVGVMRRIIVIKIDEQNLPLINPVLVNKSKEKEISEEGCLSLPGQLMEVKRFTEIEITALDLNGKKIQLKLNYLPARIFQHELDHLDGKLIIDRVPFLSKIKNLFVLNR